LSKKYYKEIAKILRDIRAEITNIPKEDIANNPEIPIKINYANTLNMTT
jgi:hypothetical protein